MLRIYLDPPQDGHQAVASDGVLELLQVVLESHQLTVVHWPVHGEEEEHHVGGLEACVGELLEDNLLWKENLQNTLQDISVGDVCLSIIGKRGLVKLFSYDHIWWRQ